MLALGKGSFVESQCEKASRRFYCGVGDIVVFILVYWFSYRNVHRDKRLGNQILIGSPHRVQNGRL
jgi:hypothetical protein